MENEKDLNEEKIEKEEENSTSEGQSGREAKEKESPKDFIPTPPPEDPDPGPDLTDPEVPQEETQEVADQNTSSDAKETTERPDDDSTSTGNLQVSDVSVNHDQEKKDTLEFSVPSEGVTSAEDEVNSALTKADTEGEANASGQAVEETEATETSTENEDQKVTEADSQSTFQVKASEEGEPSSPQPEAETNIQPEPELTEVTPQIQDETPPGQDLEDTTSDAGREGDEANFINVPVAEEKVTGVSLDEAAKEEVEPSDRKDKDLQHDIELNSEEDLAEKAHHGEGHEEEEHEDEDYSQYSKEQLVDLIKTLGKSENALKSERIAKIIKPYFEEIKHKERSEALEKFIKDGGEEEDFEYKNDELTNRFEANWKLIRDKKNYYVKNLEQQKEANLQKKELILERLRDFVDGDDPNMSFNTFKEIQNEWKHVGPVPGAHSKTLWANYNALVNRFYDNRSIYFELKELDRRKNLEAKLELCERAEKLSKMEILQDAIKELNELHHEFKHIGPVPKEEQEPLWQRFKAASDAVYARRKEHVEQFKLELKDNLEIKTKLADEVLAFTQFDSDRIKEWNAKTKDILDLQRRWEGVGSLPRAKAKELNKKFWSAFKTFFHNKGAFFKKLDAQREDNLKKKQALLDQANALKDNTDWEATANALKQLQKEWREIGPVPGKVREKIYKEFKDACDFFFDHKRASSGGVDKDYLENLKKKEAICEEIEQMNRNKVTDLDRLAELQEAFGAIGFVPKKDIGSIKSRFNKVVKDYVESIEGLSDEEKEQVRIETQVMKLKSEPYGDQKLHRKEMALQKQIAQIENDIAVWKNNMEFFASSKTADKLKDEFNDKIEEASEHLRNLKSQLRMIRSA